MSEVIEKVHAFIEPMIEGTDIFIVSIKLKPINNIKVFLDADSGLTIEKIASINRRLYPLVQEELFPEGDFSLEVSSPGIDEPLLQMRQYKKNVGRKVLVTSNEDVETTGMLKEMTDEHIVLEVKVPKVKEPVIKEIPFTDIKKTVVQIIF